MMRRALASLAAATVLAAAPGTVVSLHASASPAAHMGAMNHAQPASCASQSGFHVLDFWLGTWRVTAAGKYDGTDTIQKILSGCAVTEDWRAADGSAGKSLFYFDPFSKEWTQVWVTDQATVRGGLKIKHLIATYKDGGTRFQGTLPGPPGSKIVLDRTTLTPLRDGTVRQVIEISLDGGTTWIVEYDAIYAKTSRRG